jgi:hypothetical protein
MDEHVASLERSYADLIERRRASNGEADASALGVA